MKLIIIIVIAFLVVLYVYTYVKYKKRKSQNISSVDEFHQKYSKYNGTLDYVEKDKFLNG